MLIKYLYNYIHTNKYNNNNIEQINKLLSNKIIIDKPITMNTNDNRKFFIDDFDLFLNNYIAYLHGKENNLQKFLLSTTLMNFNVYIQIINNRKEIFKPKEKQPKLNLNKINVFVCDKFVFIRNKFKMFYDKNIIKLLNKIKLNEFYVTLNNNLEIIDFYHPIYNKYRFYLEYKNKLKIII